MPSNINNRIKELSLWAGTGDAPPSSTGQVTFKELCYKLIWNGIVAVGWQAVEFGDVGESEMASMKFLIHLLGLLGCPFG